MKILFIGDIVGKPGRDLVRKGLRALVRHHDIALAVANVENAAGGFGVTRETGEAMLDYGVEVMTSGNHVWDKKEVMEYIEEEPRLLRPANYPTGVPGRGAYVAAAADGVEVGVINLMGRVFMANIDDPFTVGAAEVARLRHRTPIVLVDFHAEASSEKIAMGWHLAGQVTAVVGTHTHVQTADAQILPGGTAYISDVGMTGPHDSVIGVDKDAALRRFLTALPAKFETATGNPKLHGVVISADPTTGKATGIERVSLTLEELEVLAMEIEQRA